MGQNFLKDNNILDNIADIGKITNEDIILEIGPGTGNLTEKILSKNPKSLIVVEKDKDLSKKLSNKFSNKLKIINKDILECYNNFKFDKPFIVYGNLPYNISTKILLSFLKIDKLDKKIKKFVLFFKKKLLIE